MDDVQVGKVLDSFHYLFKERDCFSLGEFTTFFEKVIEVIVAEFSHDVHIVISLKHIVQFYDVGMTHFFHNIDLGMQIFEVKVTGEDAFVDDFDCDWLCCFDDLSSVDRSIGTLP